MRIDRTSGHARHYGQTLAGTPSLRESRILDIQTRSDGLEAPAKAFWPFLLESESTRGSQSSHQDQGEVALSLQAGMNFGVRGTHSVILMSVRPNAPYRDRLEDGGTTLIYEGHDQPRGAHASNPKLLDQLDRLPTGNPTQNGKFNRAAQDAKAGRRRPERVRVYEKIRPGIWSDNGILSSRRLLDRA